MERDLPPSDSETTTPVLPSITGPHSSTPRAASSPATSRPAAAGARAATCRAPHAADGRGREVGMPLFGKGADDTTATWEPQAAETRLAHTAGASAAGVFTSDLSVSEYALLGEAGFEPLGFVIGSSIYHVG